MLVIHTDSHRQFSERFYVHFPFTQTARGRFLNVICTLFIYTDSHRTPSARYTYAFQLHKQPQTAF